MKQKIISFLRKEENQKRLGFDYYAGAISISEKSYSFGCRMQLFTKSREFIFGVLGSIVLISLFGYLKLTLSNNKRAKIIYSELRQKVLEDRMVNVSHMKSEL